MEMEGEKLPCARNLPVVGIGPTKTGDELLGKLTGTIIDCDIIKSVSVRTQNVTSITYRKSYATLLFCTVDENFLMN